MKAMKAIGLILALFLSGYILQTAFDMMSDKSDIDFWSGLVVTVVLIVVWLRFLIRKGEQFMKWFNGSGTKRLLLIIITAGILLQASGCTRIGPGYVGIQVKMAGSDRGVQDVPKVTGWVFYNPFASSVLEYPTFVQTAVWTRNELEGSPNNEEITFNSIEGLVITADISFSYMIVGDSVPRFYVKFRTDNLQEFTHGFVRNIARDAFNEIGVRYTVEEIYGAKKEELITSVKNRINNQLEQYGVRIEQFGFVGALRIPPSVTEALNAKIKATQDAIRVENELRQQQAEAKKLVVKAEGEAKANLTLAKSITPELIEWRQLQIAEATIEKWDGKRPMVEGGGSNMLFSLPLSNQQIGP